jgi:hypothetical protein
MKKPSLKSLSFFRSRIMTGNLPGEAGVVTGIPEAIVATCFPLAGVAHTETTAAGTNERTPPIVEAALS